LCGSALAAPEEEAVKAVVQSAYVDGVHVKGDGAVMRTGFHPDFKMLVLRDGKMTSVALEEWIGRIEARSRENPAAPRPAVRGDFSDVEISGNAAAVRLELYRDGKHAFTDYLSLYRFPEGWKIVSKTFQAH
jgi:hypothetical protein